jgi:hypothetical protein
MNDNQEGWGDVLHEFLTSSEPVELEALSLDTPERMLMRAVLGDALETVLYPTSDAKMRTQRRLDIQWFTEDDVETGGITFTRVCLMLDLDPTYLRKLLWQAVSMPEKFRKKAA